MYFHSGISKFVFYITWSLKGKFLRGKYFLLLFKNYLFLFLFAGALILCVACSNILHFFPISLIEFDYFKIPNFSSTMVDQKPQKLREKKVVILQESNKNSILKLFSCKTLIPHIRIQLHSFKFRRILCRNLTLYFTLKSLPDQFPKESRTGPVS